MKTNVFSKVTRVIVSLACAFSLVCVGSIANASPLPMDDSAIEAPDPGGEVTAAGGTTAIVAAVVAAMGLSYQIAYDDGVARAATGQVTWSQWNGAFGWSVMVAAGYAGVLGMVGYQGWKNGFSAECAKHSYCINR